MTSATRHPHAEKIITPGWVKHGYISTPPSRAYWCAVNKPGSHCGSIGNEPQSVEGPKGFPSGGPPDGQLASGGNARFSPLDGVNAPDGKPWRAGAVTPGAPLRVRWWLTAPHRTYQFHYYLTVPDYDGTVPLARSNLELITQIRWGCQPNEGWKCGTPIADTHHFVMLPSDRQGRHVLLGVWDVGDTGNAFYQAVDLNFDRDAQDDPDDVDEVIG